MFQHNCLKCKTQYQDSDPDPYYCESCKTEHQKMAKEIDRTHVPRPKVKTLLQEYDEAPKGPGGFMIVKG